MGKIVTEIGGYSVISEKRLEKRPKVVQELWKGLSNRSIIARGGSEILRTNYQIPDSLLIFDPKVTGVFNEVLAEGTFPSEKRIGYEVTTHWTKGRTNIVFVPVEDINNYS